MVQFLVQLHASVSTKTKGNRLIINIPSTDSIKLYIKITNCQQNKYLTKCLY